MGRVKDMTGQKFGRLTVIERNPYNSSDRQALWKCKCDCGNDIDVIVRSNSLRRGETQSCGCLQKETAYKARKKYNTYELSKEYGIGYTSNTNEEFYFDLDDYDKIKDYCWCKDKYNYIIAYDNRIKRMIKLHRLIMNCIDNREIEIDHRDRKRHNNKKDNLRIATRKQNNKNESLGKNNTSGYIGVGRTSRKNKWKAFISIDGKSKQIGVYEILEDAVKARLKAENEYYGEFAPQQHLFEQYGIE